MEFSGFNFLGLDSDESDFEKSKAVILPVPYERTVSFGTGCSGGPLAIIKASRSIELYDDELGCCPSDCGIHTLGELECGIDPAGMIESVKRTCLTLARKGKFVVTIGGEHSVAAGAFFAQKEIHPKVSVLSIDAHCDLRDSYQGSELSHACTMRRIADTGSTVVEAGVRSMSGEEAEFARGRKDLFIFKADRILGRDPEQWSAEVVEKLGKKVYLSVDVDGFDPSLMPSAGTPEPGGLGWRDVVTLLRAVFRSRDVVGMDIVELSPIPAMHAPDVICAKLVYKAIGYKFRLAGVKC